MDTEFLKFSPWMTSEGEVPNRIVLHRLRNPTFPDRPYATHHQCYRAEMQGDQFPLAMGHYDLTREEGAADFDKRSVNHSRLRIPAELSEIPEWKP